MTDALDLDFDPDELAMLRQLFATEAHEALEVVTTRVLAGGTARPSADALTEMMRVTHTLKGAAGTVGLNSMVDLSHRLESALELVGQSAERWGSHSADQLIEVVDGLRAYLDELVAERPGTHAAADALRTRIEAIARNTPPELEERPSFESMIIPTIVEAGEPEDPPHRPVEDTTGPHELTDATVPEPKTWLRVEPERIDALMSSAGELLFDRTRIERRVQLLRTLARDLARTRQNLRDALGDGTTPPSGQRGALSAAESELAGQAALLSQTTAALLDEIEALRRTIGELQRGLTRIRMESARNLMSHAARTLRALRRATGVQVELRTVGEDTEFDKAVAEQLVDPITQLLRNAVAHGVEPAGERMARPRCAGAA